jgi:hypothetical protein
LRSPACLQGYLNRSSASASARRPRKKRTLTSFIVDKADDADDDYVVSSRSASEAPGNAEPEAEAKYQYGCCSNAGDAGGIPVRPHDSQAAQSLESTKEAGRLNPAGNVSHAGKQLQRYLWQQERRRFEEKAAALFEEAVVRDENESEGDMAHIKDLIAYISPALDIDLDKYLALVKGGETVKAAVKQSREWEEGTSRRETR